MHRHVDCSDGAPAIVTTGDYVGGCFKVGERQAAPIEVFLSNNYGCAETNVCGPFCVVFFQEVHAGTAFREGNQGEMKDIKSGRACSPVRKHRSVTMGGNDGPKVFPIIIRDLVARIEGRRSASKRVA